MSEIERVWIQSGQIGELEEDKMIDFSFVRILKVKKGFIVYLHYNELSGVVAHANGKTVLEALANLNKVATKPARRTK